ncbi:cytochrome P450 [Phlegmacium glaucopus]|nr:cytochrome P450 [Phlegmacium glaucopus]
MDPIIYLSVLALLLTYHIWRRNNSRNLPPGPKPLPLIGNMLDLTAKELWLRVNKWGRKYGDICHLNILGQDIVFINTAKAAFDLLDKRGAIYSGKPRLVMVGELCGCGDMVPFTTYGETFRRRRKLMHQTLGPQILPQYLSGIEAGTKTFIRSLLTDSDNYVRHIRRYSGGLTLSIIYGYQAKSNDDQYLLLAEECMDLLANKLCSGPGLWPVDIFPFLRYIPAWFPGGSFKQKAAEWKPKMTAFVERPFAHAKASMKAGTISPSFCASVLDTDSSLSAEKEADLKFAAISMYAASADTTIASVSHLILAMIYYPDAFKKAREEISRVIGTERLPTFNDRASLPYVECILNETWRWGVPVPLNLPHELMEDDEYLGFTIRKKSLVIANIWSMLRDESIYPDPLTFKPERFMEADSEKKKLMDPRNYIFGFGRRRCPGADLVDRTIWLLTVTIIATVDISMPLDKNGAAIAPQLDFDNLFFRIPKPFKFAVNLRSHLLDI